MSLIETMTPEQRQKKKAEHRQRILTELATADSIVAVSFDFPLEGEYAHGVVAVLIDSPDLLGKAIGSLMRLASQLPSEQAMQAVLAFNSTLDADSEQSAEEFLAKVKTQGSA